MYDYFRNLIEKDLLNINYRSKVDFAERILRSHFNKLKLLLTQKTKKTVIFIATDWKDFMSREFYYYYKDIINNITSNHLDIYFCINNQKFFYSTFSKKYAPFQFEHKNLHFIYRRPDARGTFNDWAYLLYLLQLIDSILHPPFNIETFSFLSKIKNFYFSYIPLEDLFVRHLTENKKHFIIDNIIIHIYIPEMLYNKLFLCRKAEKYSILKGVKPLMYILYKYKIRIIKDSTIEAKNNIDLLKNYFNRFIKLLLICIRKEYYSNNYSIPFNLFLREYIDIVKRYNPNANELYFHMREIFGDNFDEKDRYFIRYLVKSLFSNYSIGVVPKQLLPTPIYPKSPFQETIKLYQTPEGKAQCLDLAKRINILLKYHLLSLKPISQQIEAFVNEKKKELGKVNRIIVKQQEEKEYLQYLKEVKLREDLYNKSLAVINEFKFYLKDTITTLQTVEVELLIVDEEASCLFSGLEYFYISEYSSYKIGLEKLEKEYYQKTVVEPYYKKHSFSNSRDYFKQATMIDHANAKIKLKYHFKIEAFKSYYKGLFDLLEKEISREHCEIYIEDIIFKECKELYNICYLYYQLKQLIYLAINNTSKEYLDTFYTDKIIKYHLKVPSKYQENIQNISNMSFSDKYLLLDKISKNYLTYYNSYKDKLLFAYFISDIIRSDKTPDIYTIIKEKEQFDKYIVDNNVQQFYPLVITNEYYSGKEKT